MPHFSDTYFDPGDGQYIRVGGSLVERDALHIAEQITEYDENLFVACLDPNKAGVNDAPFVVMCKRPDGTAYRVFEAWHLNQEVLERIYQADGHRFNPNERLTSIQDLIKKQNEDRYKERAGASMEIVEAAVRNLKSSFSFKNDEGEKVTVHDDKPVEYGHGRSYH